MIAKDMTKTESHKRLKLKRKRSLDKTTGNERKPTTDSGPAEATQFADVKPAKKRKKNRIPAGEKDADSSIRQEDNSASSKPAAAADSPKAPRPKKDGSLIKPKDPEQERRTVFVGNLPLKVRRPAVRKFFMQFGAVESVRLRSAPRLDAKKPIRMSVITHRFSADRSSLNGYVRYAEEAGAVRAAAEANGKLFMEHHLRVNLAAAELRPDPRRAVFVGGLPLNVEDDQLWRHFAECGDVASVRVVRDARSSVGKGFGYVNFADEEAVRLALKLNGSELEGRAIRVQRCHATARAKVDRATGKKLRKEHKEGDGESANKSNRPEKLAPVSKFSGDAVAESKSALKKKKKKKERWDDARRQKRNMMQSLSKTIAPAGSQRRSDALPAAPSTIAIGGVVPQNKKITFNFDEDAPDTGHKKKDTEKLKAMKLKREAKRKKELKDSRVKKQRNIAETLSNELPT